MLGGYAKANRDGIVAYAQRRDPEGLAAPLQAAIASGDESAIANISYYLLRAFLHDDPSQTQARLKRSRPTRAAAASTRSTSPARSTSTPRGFPAVS